MLTPVVKQQCQHGTHCILWPLEASLCKETLIPLLCGKLMPGHWGLCGTCTSSVSLQLVQICMNLDWGIKAGKGTRIPSPDLPFPVLTIFLIANGHPEAAIIWGWLLAVCGGIQTVHSYVLQQPETNMSHWNACSSCVEFQ